MKLAGKNIVLTGCARGIGAALLAELARFADVRIVAADREEIAAAALSPNIFPFKADLSQQHGIDLLFDFALHKMGGIDIFIANAGYAYYEKIDSPSWSHVNNLYDLDFFAIVYALEKMVDLSPKREFFFMLTASAMAKLPLPGYAIYSSAKAALHAFIQAWRWEAAPGHHACIVYPISTRTDFFQKAGQDVPQSWPQQSPAHVAKVMVRAILRQRKSVYPSKVYLCFERLNRFLPLLFPLYARVEAGRFRRWQRQQKRRSPKEPLRVADF